MIRNLQVLRAFAALSVVYLHVVSDAGLNLGIGFGGYGVDLFFVISGFTMAFIGRTGAGLFFLRRCIRIVPLYWAATLGTFLIAWFAPDLLQSASASVPHLLHSLLFLPYPNKLGLMQPTLALGWTLNYEMYFYLVFAVALLFTRRFAPLLATLLLAVNAAAIRLAGTHDKAVLFYADPIICEFALGVAVYYLLECTRAWRPVQIRAILRAPLLASAALLAVIALPLQEIFIAADRALYAGIPAMVLLLCAISLELFYSISPKHRWFVVLGDSSYVLYLIHPYIIYGVIRLLLTPAHRGIGGTALAIVVLPLLATLAAVAIHLVLERPLLEYLRGRIPMGFPARAAAAA